MEDVHRLHQPKQGVPKGQLLTPQIHLLVDSTAGHQLLSFIDAFLGYSQIKLNEFDQEKALFIISQRLFMSFGLKNTGATDQILVNKMFTQQIGWNIGVYVDNLLVKRKKQKHHLDDLQETLETLCLYNMKLNPSKCVYGVSSRKFLGFMVSK